MRRALLTLSTKAGPPTVSPLLTTFSVNTLGIDTGAQPLNPSDTIPAGSYVVVTVQTDSSSSETISATDTAGHTWTGLQFSSNAVTTAILWAQFPTAAAAGTVNLTVASASGTNYWGVQARYVTGLSPTRLGYASGTGAISTLSYGGGFTVTNPGDTVFISAAHATTGATLNSFPTGYTSEGYVSGSTQLKGWTGYQVYPAPATAQPPTGPAWSTSSAQAVIAVAFGAA